MKLYKIWELYESDKKTVKVSYCVVNVVTHKVQSRWKTYSEAARVQNDLNRFAVQVVKNIVSKS